MSGTQAQLGRAPSLAPTLSCSGVSPCSCPPGRKGLSQAGGPEAGLLWATTKSCLLAGGVGAAGHRVCSEQSLVCLSRQCRDRQGATAGGELCLFSILPGKEKTQLSVSFFPEVRRISAKAEHRVCFEPELELAFRDQHLLVTLLTF